jgi:glycosyltransferase involved in cell wall biosynthesis
MMADTYKPHVSGVTNHIELTKRYLERAGHEVYVFTFGDLEFQDDEERVIRSPGLPLADTGFYLSLRYSREARELLQSMDIVHVHHPFLSGRLALHYCRPKNIPVIFTNHTRYDLYAQAYMPVVPEQISHGLLQAYLPDFCKEVDLVISPSQGMKKVLENLGVKSHIEVVPNGVDLQQFHNATPLPREKYGFTKNDILLVYAGRIAPEKSLDLLLQSFTGVAQAIENAYLLIIGRGQEQYENELKNLTNELGLQDRLRFTGLVSYEDLPSHLAMCDIFVTASITEVHPLSIIEAMGAGLPIMGINSVGVGDTVEDGKTGFLADDNIASFTAKLTRLCLEPNLRAQMGRSAREASSAYDIERTTRIMLGHYERLSRVKQKRKKIDWEERLRRILEEFQS